MEYLIGGVSMLNITQTYKVLVRSRNIGLSKQEIKSIIKETAEELEGDASD